MTKIITITGEIAPSELGRTLVHEHVHIGMAGCEADTLHPMPDDDEIVARGTATVAALKARGIDSFIDPLPGNMGRRIDLAAEISRRTGVNIICATGLFAQRYGASSYWMGKFELANALGTGEDYVKYLADLFTNEIENGSGPGKVRCGIIKVASSTEVTPYEDATLRAAAIASLRTDVPITTHSDDGVLGADQQRRLLEYGAKPHRIVIGHSCNSRKHGYHRSVVNNGSFIAFDRFGYKVAQKDEDRIESMLALIEAGGLSRVLVSNDGTMSWRDTMQPPYWGDFMKKQMEEGWHSLTWCDSITPRLREMGVAEDVLDTILIDNPQKLFAGEGGAAPRLAEAALSTEG